MTTTLGVIVARFQVAELTLGHRHLIDTALKHHDQVFICLGERDKVPGARNPLPFIVRKRMIEEMYGTRIVVHELRDHPSDAAWSQSLDQKIRDHFPYTLPTLYCSRDGFKAAYSGQYLVVEVDIVDSDSGTQQRAAIGFDFAKRNHHHRWGGKALTPWQQPWNRDYRRGFIAATTMRHPIVFSTVDIALMNQERTHLWLGQKPTDEGRWRFFGGFVDPRDSSRRAAALRELYEEVRGIRVDETIEYVDSLRVEDFRYRDEPDGIMTDLFIATHTGGTPQAADDISAIGYFPLTELPERLVPEHQPLGSLLLTHLTMKGSSHA
jgi:bifunctional NMN adenylyltransferase/nudix hydrolase